MKRARALGVGGGEEDGGFCEGEGEARVMDGEMNDGFRGRHGYDVVMLHGE